MITIKTKSYEHEYYGNIEIYYDDNFLCIDWWGYDLPPTNEDELATWCSNGFDRFWIEDVVSIEGI